MNTLCNITRSLFVIVAISAVMLFPVAHATGISPGHYETDLGALTVLQAVHASDTEGQDAIVMFGDLGENGVLIGLTEGRCTSGVFIQDNRAAHFRVVRTGRRDAQGFYRWIGENRQRPWQLGDWRFPFASDEWTGFQNFSTNDAAVLGADGPGVSINGSYESQFGKLRLSAGNGVLIGRYADKGILVGLYDPASHAYVGRFTNAERSGQFRFPLSADGAIDGPGLWAWNQATPSEPWAISKASDTPLIHALFDREGLPCKDLVQERSIAAVELPENSFYGLTRTSSGKPWTLLEGGLAASDVYYQTKIRGSTAANTRSCQLLCMEDESCRAYSLVQTSPITEPPHESCKLYSRKKASHRYVNSFFRSALKPTDSTIFWTPAEPNIGFYSSFESVSDATVRALPRDECQASCSDKGAQCDAISFYRDESGTRCLHVSRPYPLKRHFKKVNAPERVESYVKSGFEILIGQAVKGPFLTWSVRDTGRDNSLCSTNCLRDPNCRAYTWHKGAGRLENENSCKTFSSVGDTDRHYVATFNQANPQRRRTLPLERLNDAVTGIKRTGGGLYLHREERAINSTDQCGTSGLSLNTGQFDGTFRPFCQRHDACYRLKDATQQECDVVFARSISDFCRFGQTNSVMRSRCLVQASAYRSLVKGPIGTWVYNGW